MADEDVLDQNENEEEETEQAEAEAAAKPSLQDQLKEIIEVKVEDAGDAPQEAGHLRPARHDRRAARRAVRPSCAASGRARLPQGPGTAPPAREALRP